MLRLLICWTEQVQHLPLSLSQEKKVEVINENLDTIGGESVEYNKDVSKVSIVGAGMVSTPGVATKMFEALYEAHININMISTSETKVSVLIDQKDAENAVRAIHDKFMNHESR